MKGLFAKKSLHDLKEEASNKKDGLKRVLSSFDLIAMGLGATIGAGIFVLTGQAAASYAGPAVIISFLIASLICMFAAFCYAEFASMIPVAGGAYSYAYISLGEIVAWTLGWVLTLEYLFAAATVSVAWSGYLSSFLGDMNLAIPAQFASAPLEYKDGWVHTGTLLNLPAMFIMGIIGTLIAFGIKTAARFNDIMVLIKIAVILLFVIFGIAYINMANWVPFIPENTGKFGEFGFSGILRGAGVVFFAYIGFDTLSTVAQEARNPQKDMAIGMVGSLFISAAVYILIGLILTGVVSYTLLGGPAPFSVAIDALGPKFLWLRYVAKFGILAGLTTVILMTLLSQSRIFYTMAHDGMLPKVFGKVHHKYRTPFFTTIFVTVLGMLLGGFFPVGILGELVSMGALLAFAIVCFSVVVLRYKQPNLHRPFKVPLFPWIPLAGLFVILIQMAALPSITWIQLGLWLVIGFVIYFSYGIRHSVVQKKR